MLRIPAGRVRDVNRRAALCACRPKSVSKSCYRNMISLLNVMSMIKARSISCSLSVVLGAKRNHHQKATGRGVGAVGGGCWSNCSDFALDKAMVEGGTIHIDHVRLPLGVSA